MKAYPRLFSKLFASPLMLHPTVRTSLESVLVNRMLGNGSDAVALPVAQMIEGSSKGPRSVLQIFGRVAVVKIDGVIDKRISAFDMDCYGGVDLADVDAALSAVEGDASIEYVVLDIHSPGGSVIGVPDTAARIAKLRETKEVHAFVNVMACSAGYYLASQADKITASPSAAVGSIGVYCGILDASAHYAELGFKMQFIKAGEFKTMGSEWKPLSETETAMLQESVNNSYAAFKAACTALRPIADSTMQGQWFDGNEALKLGLVDEVSTATLDEFVSGLLMQF